MARWRKFLPGCPCCDECCRDTDVLFLLDTNWHSTYLTGNVLAMRELFDSPSCRFALADYKSVLAGGACGWESLHADYLDGWRVHLPFTRGYEAFASAYAGLSGQGPAPPEWSMYSGGCFAYPHIRTNPMAALANAAQQWHTTLGGNADKNKLLVWGNWCQAAVEGVWHNLAWDAEPNHRDDDNGTPFCWYWDQDQWDEVTDAQTTRSEALSAIGTSGIHVLCHQTTGLVAKHDDWYHYVACPYEEDEPESYCPEYIVESMAGFYQQVIAQTGGGVFDFAPVSSTDWCAELWTGPDPMFGEE